MRTHEVTNTVPDFVGHDLFGTDAVLTEALARWGDLDDAPGPDHPPAGPTAAAPSAATCALAPESARLCPISMTDAAVPVVRSNPSLAAAAVTKPASRGLRGRLGPHGRKPEGPGRPWGWD